MSETLSFFKDDEEITIPAIFQICPKCRGKGVSSDYLGAFTQSDRDEVGEEWFQEYMRGEFDRQCGKCGGEKVILVPDILNMKYEDIQAWENYQWEEENDRRTQRMEMGMYGDM